MTQLFTIPETAKFLKISTPTVRRHIRLGVLPIVRIGRRVRISSAQLEKVASEGIPMFSAKARTKEQAMKEAEK